MRSSSLYMRQPGKLIREIDNHLYMPASAGVSAKLPVKGHSSSATETTSSQAKNYSFSDIVQVLYLPWRQKTFFFFFFFFFF